MWIERGGVVLRDMVERDIEDYVRWFTTEREWETWDAPWEREPAAPDQAEQERTRWREYYESVKRLPEAELRWKFEIEYDGNHIGWVSSYLIDEHYGWISASRIRAGYTVYRAIGIDICEKTFWGRGIGTEAFRAFTRYYLENGYDELYTQTWSGNTRMLRTAAKLGFTVCKRLPGEREVDGGKYDALTLRFVGAERRGGLC